MDVHRNQNEHKSNRPLIDIMNPLNGVPGAEVCVLFSPGHYDLLWRE